MREQRKSRRFRTRRRVWCESERFTVFLTLANASSKGAFIRTSIPPPPGTALRISLDHADGERVVAEADVVWVKPGGSGGMGLRIRSFTEGEDTWARLLAELERGGHAEPE